MPQPIEVELALTEEIIETLAEMKVREIREAMLRRHNNKTQAAKDLGISQRTLRRHWDRLKYVPIADNLSDSQHASS